MEKKIYITKEERVKCQKVADAFTELYEIADIVVLDAGRYGFVMLKYYTPPHGFEEDATFTDSRTLFEELYQEWLNTKLCYIAKEMGMNDILYEKVFKSLSEEKRSEFIGRKTDFARTAEIILQNYFVKRLPIINGSAKQGKALSMTGFFLLKKIK